MGGIVWGEGIIWEELYGRRKSERERERIGGRARVIAERARLRESLAEKRQCGWQRARERGV